MDCLLPATSHKIFTSKRFDDFSESDRSDIPKYQRCRCKPQRSFAALNMTPLRASLLNHYALINDETRGKFTVSIHECQFPRADAGAHARACRLTPSGHGHRPAIIGLRCSRTAGLELTARAIRSRWVRSRFRSKTPFRIRHDLPRCAALKARHCVPRFGWCAGSRLALPFVPHSTVRLARLPSSSRAHHNSGGGKNKQAARLRPA